MLVNKGAFIVIEGADGIGKTEQTKRLVNGLNAMGITSVFTKTPGEKREEGLIGSSLGPIVRDVLFTDKYPCVGYESKSLLLLADHLQLIEEVVKPGINERKIIISDRFMDSQFTTWGKPMYDKINVTFQMFYTHVPDLTILLIGDPKECFHRATNRSNKDNVKQASKPWSSLEGLTAIQDRYKTIVGNQTNRAVVTVDSTGLSIEETQKIISDTVIEWLVKNQYLTRELQETLKNNGTSTM